MTVSMVNCATDTDTRNVDAIALLETIRDGGRNLRGAIEAICKSNDADRECLKKKLPAVTWSGTFSRRESGALVRHSGLLCADLDGLNDDLDGAAAKLKTSPHLWAVFISPSGTGLKAVFRMPADATKHAGSFRAVERHVFELTGMQIDASGKDVTRLCFLSHDPELYHNPNATEIAPLPEPEKPKQTTTGVVNVSERQQIAMDLLGCIDWQSEAHGFLTCPGKHMHTTGDNVRDCEINIDGAPTVFCFHNSCRGIIDAINRELRSRIGKAEHQPVNILTEPEPVELSPPPKLYVPPPLELLPAVLQDYIHAAAESINVDVAFILLPIFSSLATAIGNSRAIRLKAGFIQPPVIWSGIIARSGGRKSPSEDEGCFATWTHERELMRQNQEAAELYNEELAQWERQKGKRGTKPEKPPFRTCTCDDLTIEVLADILATNPRGILVRKDELSHWLASFDQYKSAHGSDVSRWLSLHTAVALAVDRRTDARHYRIANPRVSITGGIQPKILRRALTAEAARVRHSPQRRAGGFQRVFCALPARARSTEWARVRWRHETGAARSARSRRRGEPAISNHASFSDSLASTQATARSDARR
jgi:hypothetical protein